MANGPGDDLAWERLADALIQRRVDLHYPNRRAFTDARQIDYRLIFDIEKARRVNFGKATMLDVARAYAVTPESMERTLRGGDLEPVSPGPRPGQSGRFQAVPGTGGQFTDSRERDAARAVRLLMAGIVESVRRDIDDARLDEDEAGLWDLDLLPEDTRIEMIATLRRIRLEDEPGNPEHAPRQPRQGAV